MAVGTPVNLTAGLDTVDASSFTTAAFTPTANAKLLAWVNVGHRTVQPTFPSSLSGHGVTWTKVIDVQTSNNTWNCSLWEGVASGSPSSGTLTFTLAATAESCTWRVVEATDAQIVQTKSLATSSSNPSLTLDNAIGSGGVTLGFLLNNNATTTISAGSGYTDLGSQQSTSTAPVFKGAAEYDMTGTTTVNFVASGTVTRALVGVELGPSVTNYNGTATLSATDSITASGQVGKATGSSLSATDSITATGKVGKQTAASLSATATITATGSVSAGATNYDGTASLSATDSITASGQVGKATGSSLSATDSITASGQVGKATGSSLAATVTITATGSVGTGAGDLDGTATLSATDSITASGQVGKATGSSLAATATLTAAGTIGRATGSSLSATATITATGQVGTSSGATLSATVTVTATGASDGAPSVTNPRATVTTTRASASVTMSTRHATLPDESTAVITPNRARGVIT